MMARAGFHASIAASARASALTNQTGSGERIRAHASVVANPMVATRMRNEGRTSTAMGGDPFDEACELGLFGYDMSEEIVRQQGIWQVQ